MNKPKDRTTSELKKELRQKEQEIENLRRLLAREKVENIVLKQKLAYIDDQNNWLWKTYAPAYANGIGRTRKSYPACPHLKIMK